MGTTPTADNTLADFWNGLISAFIAGDEAAVETYIGAQVPFLEAPIISFFTNEVISEIGNAVRKQLSQIATVITIDSQTDNETSAIKVAWKNLLAAEAGGDPNAISNAQQAYINAAASLAHSDGSASNASS